jgi:hypothetical protein
VRLGLEVLSAVMLLLIGCTSMWRLLLTLMSGSSGMGVCAREG